MTSPSASHAAGQVSRPAAFAAAAFSILLAAATPAPGADGESTSATVHEDPMDALETLGGVELRPDARLYALYAALNAMGYDVGGAEGQAPFPRRTFSPLRQRVRDSVRLPEDVRQGFLQIFRASSAPLADYESCALSLDGRFHVAAGASGRCPGPLAALPSLLEQAWSRGGMAAAYPEAARESRSALKPALPLLDRAIPRLVSLVGEEALAPRQGAPRFLVLHCPLSAQPPAALESDGLAISVGEVTMDGGGEDQARRMAFHILRLAAGEALRRNSAVSTSAPNPGDAHLACAIAAEALEIPPSEMARLVPDSKERAAIDRARRGLAPKKPTPRGGTSIQKPPQ